MCIPEAAICRKRQSTTFSWTAPARSASGREPGSNRTIPVDGCDFCIITIRQWRRRLPFRVPTPTRKCTCVLRKETGCVDLERGWPCCACCRSWPGSAGSQGCRPCAGSVLPCTDLSRAIVIVFPAHRSAARPIRVCFPRTGGKQSDHSNRVIPYSRRESCKEPRSIFKSAMNSPARPSPETIPMLDLHAQYESIAPEIRAAIDEVLAAQQFVLGPQCEAFEQEVARACSTRYGGGVASGTEALELSLHACGLGAGDEVIVPAFTFIATGSAVTTLGARPVFADIEHVTFNLDPSHLEMHITPRTRAIVVVHLFGLAADMDPILTLAAKHGIPVVEDNAQSIGASYHGRKTGSMGRAGCLSFYPSKNLGAYGDAGMIVTNDEKLATSLRALRNHGQA